MIIPMIDFSPLFLDSITEFTPKQDELVVRSREVNAIAPVAGDIVFHANGASYEVTNTWTDTTLTYLDLVLVNNPTGRFVYSVMMSVPLSHITGLVVKN